MLWSKERAPTGFPGRRNVSLTGALTGTGVRARSQLCPSIQRARKKHWAYMEEEKKSCTALQCVSPGLSWVKLLPTPSERAPLLSDRGCSRLYWTVVWLTAIPGAWRREAFARVHNWISARILLHGGLPSPCDRVASSCELLYSFAGAGKSSDVCRPQCRSDVVFVFGLAKSQTPFVYPWTGVEAHKWKKLSRARGWLLPPRIPYGMLFLC